MLDTALPVEVILVDRNCRVQEVAERHGIACVTVERTDFSPTFDRDAYTRELVTALEPFDLDLVVMAGFGTILGVAMHEAYEGHILNTHPALLPSFKGWHAVRDALAYGVKVTGCTVHVATLEVDEGPILAQEAVDVVADDDEASLHERIKAVERRLYVETVFRVLRDPELLRGSVATKGLTA